jgi:hypothetical protein
LQWNRLNLSQWKIVDGNDTIEINNFKVTKAAVKYLVFGNSINADNERGEDRLMLYPMWRIGVELDKYYPGNVFGIYVDIWADTGEIRNIQEVVSTLPPSDAEFASIEESTQPFADGVQNLPSTIWIALLAPAVLVIGLMWITKKKNLPKRYYKITGVLLILIYAAILPITVSTANATELKGRATVWGSLAPYKTEAEKDWQELICFYISNWFTWSSYVTHNYQGTGTTKGALLSSIHVSEGVYPFVATVWFDHGPGEPLDFPEHPNEFHFMLRDSNNLQIYDYDIGQQTTGKTFFAFISVCCSGNLDLKNSTGYPLGNGEYGNSGNNYKNPIGMPYAWTHGADLSTDGYDYPDSGPYCYISFPWGAAALDQEVDPDDYSGVLYYDWLFTFFGAALNDDMSVNDALDHASLLKFPPQDFGDTDLHTGFTAEWPKQGGGYDYGYYSTMKVYGNGDIHLQYPVDVQAYDNNNQYVHSKVTVDGYASYGSTFGWVRAPPGTHLIGVENNPDDWRTFTHFDGHGAGENPIAVNVNSRPTITAYYDAAEVPYYFVSSIYDYGWYGQAGVDSPENMIGTTNDGQYATLYAGYQPSQAWIIGEMYTQATGRIKLYGYSSVNSYVHVYVSNDGSNYDLVVEGYNPPSSPRWIDCGTYSSPFRYIAIAVSTDYVPANIAIDSVRVEPPTNYTLTVSSSGGGYTDPTGNIEYPYYTYAHVQAYAAPGWQLDHWLLDNENAGNDPSIDVYMDDDHVLQAVFCEEPLQHSLTVLAYNQYGQPGSVPLYIDDVYVGTTGYAYTVTAGDHQIYVESPLTDGYTYYHEFQYYYYDGNYNYDNPMTLSVTEDKTVTAYYYSYYA